MKIGEVSNIVGISTSAIRFYERHGLLSSIEVSRAGNGYRIYSSKDVDEIILIVKLKELGLELAEIKKLVCGDANSCSDLVSSLESQLIKFRKIESLVKERIGFLLSAKKQCELKCTADDNITKCCY